jgi:2,4-diaminopentanoate dehydrogenase
VRQPYRIIVCGPGGGGLACIRAALKMPEVELIGVLVYSEAKDGLDVAKLAGLPPCGVKAFKDRKEIYRLQPDCVLYTGKDLGNFNFDDEVIDLLENGIDVIAAQPYHFMGVREPEISQRIETACKAGSSTLYATGVCPGFMFERLALTATGASNHIKHIMLEEFIRTGMAESEETMNLYGFGIPLEDAKNNKIAVQIAEQYERQFLFYAGEVLGVPIDRLEQESHYEVTPITIQAPTMVLKENTVAFARHSWAGLSHSGTRLTFQTNWYMSDEFMPAGVPCEDFYRITIEGDPSLRIGVELKASIEDDLRISDEDPSAPYFRVLAATMLQAVPGTCHAKAGIRLIAPPSNAYWKRDMRGKYLQP